MRVLKVGSAFTAPTILQDGNLSFQCTSANTENQRGGVIRPRSHNS